jgi:Sec-independent protein secretion pathway component TatC
MPVSESISENDGFAVFELRLFWWALLKDCIGFAGTFALPMRGSAVTQLSIINPQRLHKARIYTIVAA